MVKRKKLFDFGMRSINQHYTDFKFDFVRYIKSITTYKKLIDVYYFIAPLKQNLNKEIYRLQQILLTRMRKGLGSFCAKEKKEIMKKVK